MLELLMREWRLLLHERPSVMFVLVCAASAYALLIGNLYRNETVQNIPVAVCDLDDTPLSRELVKAVMDADQYDYRETLTDEFISVEKLRSGELAAVLIIPEDFAKKFYTQQPIDLAFMQDGANTLQAGYAAAPMQQAVGVFSAQFATNAAMSNGTPQLSPSAISVSVRTFGNPTQSYPEFYVYGVMLMATQIGMIMGFSMSMYEDFNGGFFDNGNVEKIWAAKSMILCLAFLFVVENFSGIAALFFRTKIGLCQCMVFSERTRTFARTWKFFGSALSLMTFYGMLKYKLAARRKH